MMGIYVLWKKNQYVEFVSNVMHFEEQMQSVLYCISKCVWTKR